ncbi:MAG: 5'-methylthioadenosine/S-adenosylhomocysteine nucleosidase family protein [Bdellovibrionota bacterium]
MDYAELLTSVAKNKRTQKFTTIAALYCLGAQDNPAPVADVNALMKQHLRGQAPPNLSNVLSKNAGLVSPVGGKPIKWKLLEKGLQYLREKTGMHLKSLDKASSMEYLCDVGIVCALESPEFDAVMKSFGGEASWSEIAGNKFAHVYRETRISTVKGESLRVVGVTSTSMGLTAAAIATTQLVLQFRPRLVIMIGIAAGTKDGKKQFGDILVADPSVDYSAGKVEMIDDVREFRPDPYPLGVSPRLKSLLRKLPRDSQIFSDVLKKWSGTKPERSPRLYIGPVGAADQVIDDESKIKEIQLNWRKLIGVEMETYGVYRACNEAPEPKPRFISFKSVCDFAANKDDKWQDYAAYTAAEFTRLFLTNDWHLMWTDQKGEEE